MAYPGGRGSLPMPPVPTWELERIFRKTHLSTYCQREAVREYDAFLRGEDYAFVTPRTDADGFLEADAQDHV